MTGSESAVNLTNMSLNRARKPKHSKETHADTGKHTNAMQKGPSHPTDLSQAPFAVSPQC